MATVYDLILYDLEYAFKAEFDAKKIIDRPTKSILRGQRRTPKLTTCYSRVLRFSHLYPFPPAETLV